MVCSAYSTLLGEAARGTLAWLGFSSYQGSFLHILGKVCLQGNPWKGSSFLGKDQGCWVLLFAAFSFSAGASTKLLRRTYVMMKAIMAFQCKFIPSTQEQIHQLNCLVRHADRTASFENSFKSGEAHCHFCKRHESNMQQVPWSFADRMRLHNQKVKDPNV